MLKIQVGLNVIQSNTDLERVPKVKTGTFSILENSHTKTALMSTNSIIYPTELIREYRRIPN